MVPASDRFYTALSGKEPDRVPAYPKIWLDSAASLTGTIMSDILEDPSLAMEVIVKAALAVKADGARLFHFPSRRIGMHKDRLMEVDREGHFMGRIDMDGGLATQLDGSELIHLEDPCQMAFIQFWNTKDPLVNSLADVKRIAVPSRLLYGELGFAGLQKGLLRRYSDGIALIGDCASATLAFCVLYRKLANALTDFIVNPELVHALMEKGVAIATEKGKFNIDCGHKMLRVNDSVANMNVISPKHFKEFIFPHLKTLCDELHHYDPCVKIYCHICGNIFPIIDDLVGCGLDCIGPLDPLGGFSALKLHQEVGNRVALMGGVNTLSFMNETTEQIEEESKVCLEIFGKKGYILGSGCVVPRSSKKENLLALRTSTERFGTTK